MSFNCSVLFSGIYLHSITIEVAPKAAKPAVEKKTNAVVVVPDMTEEEKKKAQEENDLVHATELFGKLNSKSKKMKN